MNSSTTVRDIIVKALKDFSFNDTVIPVFDEVVNPNTTIPTIDGAQVYIVIQDQQFTPSNYSSCGVMDIADVTIKVVTIFGSVGGKKLSEDIGYKVDSIFRDEKGRSKIEGVKHVRLSVCRSFSEVTADEIAFSNILIYEFHV